MVTSRHVGCFLRLPKRKKHWIVLLFGLPLTHDHLLFTTKILWPNCDRINGVLLYVRLLVYILSGAHFEYVILVSRSA